MKGVILAGGTGSRLYPLTKITNKHLLPVYNKPMIYYPLQTLIDGGITEIMLVSSKDHAGHFLKLLGSGKDFGVNIQYEIQEEAGGIAHALYLVKDFAKGQNITVILGDNIFEDNIQKQVDDFDKHSQGAKIFLKEVDLESAKRFGVAEINGGKVLSVEEKPQKPKSNLAMTGLYMFDSQVFDFIKNLKPSARGELEITDAIMKYLNNNELSWAPIKGFWSDAGTFESLFRATSWVKMESDKR